MFDRSIIHLKYFQNEGCSGHHYKLIFFAIYIFPLEWIKVSLLLWLATGQNDGLYFLLRDNVIVINDKTYILCRFVCTMFPL